MIRVYTPVVLGSDNNDTLFGRQSLNMAKCGDVIDGKQYTLETRRITKSNIDQWSLSVHGLRQWFKYCNPFTPIIWMA